jgi:hypothetical protein
MATEAEKEELLQTLKFTPVKSRLLIQGYGGECYIGSVSREDYEVFKSKRIDLDQYLSDWDNELFKDIPEKNRFIEPGQAYECDDLFHGSGATMDSGSYITVTNDETNEDIFETALEFNTLDAQGITVECGDEFDSDDLDDGSVIFWGGQGEKGCFFDAEFVLTKPFDPKLLTLTYGNGDGWYLLTGVEYDGVELEGYDGYSTAGKWGENKFHIVGDEEVYQGEEREEGEEWDPAEELEKIEVPVLEGEEMWASEAIDSEIQRSEWFDRDTKPFRKGIYEAKVDASWPLPGMIRAEWTGRSWKDGDGRKVEILSWRGLAQDPALVV